MEKRNHVRLVRTAIMTTSDATTRLTDYNGDTIPTDTSGRPPHTSSPVSRKVKQTTIETWDE